MHRLRLAVAALALVAVSCGGSDTQDLLTDLGLSEEQAACLTREYEARDLDVDKLLRADENTDLTDEELEGLREVALECGPGDTSAGTDDTAADDTADTTSKTAPDTSATAGDSADGLGDDDSNRGDDDLSPLEQAFIDGMEAEGLDSAAGLCILGELESAGFSIFDLAAMGLDGSEPPVELFSVLLRCGDELADAGLADVEGIFGSGLFDGQGDAEAFTYGDDAELDAMWDDCDAGDMTACDSLYWLSAIDSEYETFGSTCGLTGPPTSGGCSGETDFGTSAGGSYGDDPTLDALYDACAAGDMVACDDLYWDSPLGSDYEAFAATCGDTLTGFNGGSCDGGGEPNTYGDDADFDADWDACAAGDMAACDSLYLWSPFGSEYEAFGSTCGNLGDEEYFGACEETFG